MCINQKDCIDYIHLHLILYLSCKCLLKFNDSMQRLKISEIEHNLAFNPTQIKNLFNLHPPICNLQIVNFKHQNCLNLSVTGKRPDDDDHGDLESSLKQRGCYNDYNLNY